MSQHLYLLIESLEKKVDSLNEQVESLKNKVDLLQEINEIIVDTFDEVDSALTDPDNSRLKENLYNKICHLSQKIHQR